jgi:hypothetical protein
LLGEPVQLRNESVRISIEDLSFLSVVTTRSITPL